MLPSAPARPSINKMEKEIDKEGKIDAEKRARNLDRDSPVDTTSRVTQ